MKFITIEQAREHCKTDGVDDEMLTIYANAAEKACAQLANRDLFLDQAELDAAIAGVPASMAAAFTAYNDAINAAGSLDADNKAYAEQQASSVLLQARVRANNIINGIPVNDDIIAAILLTTAHFYRNREEVVAGAQANVNQLPMGAERIMGWYRWTGSL